MIARTYARVFKARDIGNRKVVAVKIILVNRDEGTPGIRETALHFGLSHPNIISMFDDHQLEHELIIVTELCETDLRKYIDSKKADQNYSPSLNDIKFIIYQILNAIAYLNQHKAKITHRDIKPENIFMNQGLHLKLGDFGHARSNAIPNKWFYWPEVVTLYYRAPELLLGQPGMSAGVDVWSIGCVMAELYTGERLFRGANKPDQLRIIAQKMGIFREEVWPGISQFQFYESHLSQFPGKDIIDSLPEINDNNAKILLRSLLRCPTRENAKSHLSHPWFDNGIDSSVKYD